MYAIISLQRERKKTQTEMTKKLFSTEIRYHCINAVICNRYVWWPIGSLERMKTHIDTQKSNNVRANR